MMLTAPGFALTASTMVRETAGEGDAAGVAEPVWATLAVVTPPLAPAASCPEGVCVEVPGEEAGWAPLSARAAGGSAKR